MTLCVRTGRRNSLPSTPTTPNKNNKNKCDSPKHSSFSLALRIKAFEAKAARNNNNKSSPLQVKRDSLLLLNSNSSPCGNSANVAQQNFDNIPTTNTPNRPSLKLRNSNSARRKNRTFLSTSDTTR
eukprot:354670_1